MAGGKETAVKTKRSYRRKTPKIAPNPYSGIGVWAFLRFGSKSAIRQQKGGASYAPVCRAISRENGGLETDALIFTEGGVMTVMDMKTGFSERISGTIFVVSAMPAESAKHTQEEIVKALIARAAMALQEADIA